MDKEEAELFKLAESILDESDWESIDTEIETKDDPLFGKILDQEYEELFKVILSEVNE